MLHFLTTYQNKRYKPGLQATAFGYTTKQVVIDESRMAEVTQCQANVAHNPHTATFARPTLHTEPRSQSAGLPPGGSRAIQEGLRRRVSLDRVP